MPRLLTLIPIVLLAGTLVACGGGNDEGGPFGVVSAGQSTAPVSADVAGLARTPAHLERVVDGDTIDVRMGETRERVRLIGIDTPERGEPGAAEATARLGALLADRPLYLEADTTDRDRYERLLRYVWTPEADGWTLVNRTLVAEGLARVYLIPPDERYAEQLRAAEATARAAARGLWRSAPPPQPEPAGGRCDPSYPSVCIPPPPPDLDCGEISLRRFRVDAPDPHRFDRDRDGIGCES